VTELFGRQLLRIEVLGEVRAHELLVEREQDAGERPVLVWLVETSAAIAIAEAQARLSHSETCLTRERDERLVPVFQVDLEGVFLRFGREEVFRQSDDFLRARRRVQARAKREFGTYGIEHGHAQRG